MLKNIKDAKPGDIVEFITPNYIGSFTPGKKYIVRDKLALVNVVLDDNEFTNNGHNSKHFKLVATNVRYSPNDGVIRVDTQEELEVLCKLWKITLYKDYRHFPMVAGNRAVLHTEFKNTRDIEVYTTSSRMVALATHTFQEYIDSKGEQMEPQVLTSLKGTTVVPGDTVTICTADQFQELYGEYWRTCEDLDGGWNPSLDKYFGTSHTVTEVDSDGVFLKVKDASDLSISTSMCISNGTVQTPAVPTQQTPKAEKVTKVRTFLPKKKDPSPLEVYKGLVALTKKEGWVTAMATNLFLQALTEGYAKMRSKVETVVTPGNSVPSKILARNATVVEAATTYKITNIHEAYLVYHLHNERLDGTVQDTIKEILSTSKNPTIKKELDTTLLFTPFKRMSNTYCINNIDKIYDNLVITRDTYFECANVKALKTKLYRQIRSTMNSKKIFSITPKLKLNVKA